MDSDGSDLYALYSPHILMGLDGVEIFTNSSGSHHELRKLYTRIELIKEATLKVSSTPQHRFSETLKPTLIEARRYIPICQSTRL